MENYLGLNLRYRNEEVSTMEIKETEMILLYFAAFWSPPCRRLTPILKKFYDEVNPDTNNKQIEIVFISCDIAEDQFEANYEEMPWYAVPFQEQGIKDIITRHYEVSGIPQLILVNENGTVVSDTCRMDIMSLDTNSCLDRWKDKAQKRSRPLAH